MFTARFLTTDSGDELVVISRCEYDALRRKAETEEDVETVVADAMEGGDEWLAAARKARRWSQARLARESELSQSYISQLENERCSVKPTRETIVKLARALRVSPNYGAWDLRGM